MHRPSLSGSELYGPCIFTAQRCDRVFIYRRYAGLVATLILELLSGVPLRTAVASAATELGITNLDELARVPPPVHEDGRPMLPAAFGDLPVIQKGFGLSCCKLNCGLAEARAELHSLHLLFV